MKATELIVVAALSTIMSAVGIKALSPEAQEMADTVQLAARVQDWKWEYASEISGHDYTVGIASPVDIGEVVAAAPTLLENPDIKTESEAAVIRWTTTQ